jgi:hypothetical protein
LRAKTDFSQADEDETFWKGADLLANGVGRGFPPLSAVSHRLIVDRRGSAMAAIK